MIDSVQMRFFVKIKRIIRVNQSRIIGTKNNDDLLYYFSARKKREPNLDIIIFYHRAIQKPICLE